MMLDTHTADGLKVALEHRQAGVTMIVLETAQPANSRKPSAKRSVSSRCARQSSPVSKSCRNTWSVMAPDVAAIKAFIVERV